MLWYLLPVATTWLTWSAVQLVHECGHARVAERYSENVVVDAGGPPFALLPPSAARWLGLRATDVWLGPMPWRGGCCGHADFDDQDGLCELYRAGYRATLPIVPLGLLLGGLAIAAGLYVDWGQQASDSLILAGIVVAFIPAAHTAENRLIRVSRRDAEPGIKPRHGSDAWNLDALAAARAAGEVYVPQATDTAADIRVRRRRA